MNTRKIIFGSLIGTLIGLAISSTYFFAFLVNVRRKLRRDLKRYDNLK